MGLRSGSHLDNLFLGLVGMYPIIFVIIEITNYTPTQHFKDHGTHIISMPYLKLFISHAQNDNLTMNDRRNLSVNKSKVIMIQKVSVKLYIRNMYKS